MKTINKAQYEEILFTNDRKLVVKQVKKGLRFVESIFEGVEVIAQRIITANGVQYFAK